MHPKLILSLLIATCIHLIPQHGYAGTNCDNKGMSMESFQNGLRMAEKTVKALDESGAKLVVLARRGSDLSKYNVYYSHLGFAYKTEDGYWRVVHKLNQCGTAQSALFKQGLGEFYLDNLWRQEGGFVIPSAEMQAKLLAVITNPTLAKRMHEPKYSMVSYPWSTKYQQSNQWAIETLALAADNTLENREQAQAWLKLHRYQASIFEIGPFTRLGGRVTAANITFNDHPDEQRYANKIETSSADNILQWLKKEQLAGNIQAIK